MPVREYNKKRHILNLAINELNAKWYAVRVYCQCNELDEDTDGIEMIQKDLDHINELVGKPIFLDSNYSNTWGYEAYGMYQTLEEMLEVSEIVDSGF